MSLHKAHTCADKSGQSVKIDLDGFMVAMELVFHIVEI